MRGIFAEWIFSRIFSRAAFLIKASRPENAFKLSSWTLNPSLLFTRLHRKEREKRKAEYFFQTNQFPPLEPTCMYTRANNTKREKKTEREKGKEGYIYFTKRKNKPIFFHLGELSNKIKVERYTFLFIVSNITEYKQRSYYI